RNPLPPQAVRVLLEEERDGLLLEDLVEGERVRGVLLVRGQGHVLLADGPAVVAAIALHPPAVEDAAVDPAVDRALLAAGAAGLLGPARGVEPHVAALRHHP